MLSKLCCQFSILDATSANFVCKENFLSQFSRGGKSDNVQFLCSCGYKGVKVSLLNVYSINLLNTVSLKLHTRDSLWNSIHCSPFFSDLGMVHVIFGNLISKMNFIMPLFYICDTSNSLRFHGKKGLKVSHVYKIRNLKHIYLVNQVL